MSSYVEVVELCVCIVIDRFKLGVIEWKNSMIIEIKNEK